MIDERVGHSQVRLRVDKVIRGQSSCKFAYLRVGWGGMDKVE